MMPVVILCIKYNRIDTKLLHRKNLGDTIMGDVFLPWESLYFQIFLKYVGIYL